MSEPAPTPRAVMLDDVYRVIGMLTLELDQLRRENLALRATLESRSSADAPT